MATFISSSALPLERHTLKSLTDIFNAQTGKSVKVGSYTKAKLIETLKAQARIQEIAEDPLPGFARNLDKAPTAALAKKTKIEFEPGSNESAPTPHEVEPPKAEAEADGSCPLCGGEPCSQTAAGAEGTFLGDDCCFCHECGKTWNHHNRKEVEVNLQGSSKKRRILNPQVKINAKVEACEAVGIRVEYNKPTRLWVFVKGGAILSSMTSREFAQYSPTELVAYIAKRA